MRIVKCPTFTSSHRSHNPYNDSRRTDSTLFAVVAESGRTLTGSAHDTQLGCELRLAYGDKLMRSELFRSADRDERIAETADALRLALLEKGFEDNPL